MELRKFGAYAGFAGVVVLLVGFFMPGTPPDPDAGATEIANFLSDKESTLKIAVPLLLLGVALIGFFLLGLFDRLRDESPWAYGVLLGGAPSGAIATLGILAIGGVVLNGRLDESATAALFAAQNAAFNAGVAFDIILLVSIAMIATAPGWLRGYSVLLTVVAVVSLFGVVNSSVAIVGLGYFVLFMIWVVAASVWLLRPAEGTASAAVPART